MVGLPELNLIFFESPISHDNALMEVKYVFLQ